MAGPPGKPRPITRASLSNASPAASSMVEPMTSVLTPLADVHDLGVAPRGEQGHHRRLELLELEKRRHQVALHVVDADEWELTGPGRGLGERVAHEEGPHQPGAGGRSHPVEIGGMDPGFVEGLMGEGPDGLDVGTGRHLGYHAPEPGVEVDLRCQDVR